jgi:hypothetical protein
MTLEISEDAALVLLALLDEYGERDDGRILVINHAAERNALWALEAALEPTLLAPFQPDYAEQVAAARTRMEERGGGWNT